MQLLDELLPSRLEVDMNDICVKYILVIVLLISLVATAEAYISLQMNFYNSDDSMLMSLEGYNLEFESFCELTPDSLLYNNGGTSKKDDAEYAYSLSLNGESLYSSAETDSGKFEFHGSIDAGKSEGNLFTISSRSAVKDGKLSLEYGNNELQVQETANAKSSGYQQEVQIKPGNVISQGGGSTLESVPGLMEKLKAISEGSESSNTAQAEDDAGSKKENGDMLPTTQSTQASDNSADPEDVESEIEDISDTEGSQIQGIQHSLELKYGDKTGSIYTDVIGSTEAEWATKVSCDPDAYFFGVRVRGVSTEPLEDLDMTGKASNFPDQFLPPGTINISYNNDYVMPDIESAEDYAEMVEEEASYFDAKYSGASTPSLWYALNNLYYNKVPIEYAPVSNFSVGLEIYNFGMGFTVNEK